MILETDKQTIEDLRLFAGNGYNGIFDLYNSTSTRGGEQALEQMFRNPLSDQCAITERSNIISSFASMGTVFPVTAALLDTVEKYMIDANRAGNESRKMSLSDKDIHNGVVAIVELFHMIKAFLITGDIIRIKELDSERNELLAVLDEASLKPLFEERPGAKLSYAAVTAFDVLLRSREMNKVSKVLQFIYRLDVYITVATVSRIKNFVFPVAHPKGTTILQFTGVYHPELKVPVSNNFEMDGKTNLVFLTGANMAGKSTFLRAISVAVYIAHMGFPVAARSMEFSVLDGIYTTINLPDNLGIGASHFYAEVLRVKKVAVSLSTGKSFMIVFDELFRGTNVKDAQEGTIEVLLAFAKKTNSLFVISSHIVEAATTLSRKTNIGLHYLPTKMNGHQPEYTYKLEKGTSDDRHGMIIIRNAGILDTLRNGRKNIPLPANHHEISN